MNARGTLLMARGPVIAAVKQMTATILVALGIKIPQSLLLRADKVIE